MVRGFYFSEEPNMSTFSDVDILAKLDTLNIRDDRKREEAPTPDEDKNMIRNSFDAGEFYIDSFTTECFLAHSSLFKIFCQISAAAPDLLRVINYSDSAFFIAYNKFSDIKDNLSYTILLEELTRISTYLSKENDEDECIEFLKGYIELCLSTPKTRK